MKRIGKLGKAWAAARRILKTAFERAGITRCEHCGSTFFLTWAHSLKRRNIPRNSPLLFEVALLCQKCHAKFELMKESDMAACIRSIIASRDKPVEI